MTSKSTGQPRSTVRASTTRSLVKQHNLHRPQACEQRTHNFGTRSAWQQRSVGSLQRNSHTAESSPSTLSRTKHAVCSNKSSHDAI